MRQEQAEAVVEAGQAGRNRLAVLPVVVLLGVLTVLSVGAIESDAPTADEQNHVSRGYHYLVTGNLDLNIAPPFVNSLSGIPLLLQRGIVVPSYDASFRKTYINQFADEFVWVYNDAETVINSSRLMTVLLSLLLGYFVFRWASELWGLRAGLLALSLYVFDPNILAHSHLVTTDLGLACLSFVSVYFVWRFLQRRRASDLGLAGISVGLAMATKLSAPILMPICGVVLLIEAGAGTSVTHGGRWPLTSRLAATKRTSRAYFAVASMVTLILIAFLTMWACYRFEMAPLAARGEHATIDRWVQTPLLRSAAYWLVENVPIPFPTYLDGLQWLQRYTQRGAPAFLMGQRSQSGWWYYFLVAFAIKTPLPTVGLFCVSLYLTIRKRYVAGKRVHVLLVPVAAFFTATLFSFLSIGYRHILPVVPFVIVLASGAATVRNRRWAGGLIVALAVWCAVGTLSLHPHYLAYFNELTGGPGNGYKYLVDSNLDWGQDLKNLKRFMDDRGLSEIRLSYFGSAYPDYYGIKALPVPMVEPADLEAAPPQLYAISATHLQTGYLGDEDAFSWLRSHQPVGSIGYSILLFELPEGKGSLQ